MTVELKHPKLKDQIHGGILGLAVADALGVPVEFQSRESLRNNPVTDMQGYGTYDHRPAHGRTIRASLFAFWTVWQTKRLTMPI